MNTYTEFIFFNRFNIQYIYICRFWKSATQKKKKIQSNFVAKFSIFFIRSFIFSDKLRVFPINSLSDSLFIFASCENHDGK